MSAIDLYIDHWWREVQKKVRKAVVFMDEDSVEVLHWHGGIKRMLDAGAVAVKELSSFESAQEDQKKAVFIVCKPVTGLTADMIHEIIKNSKLEYTVIITAAPSTAHYLARYPGTETTLVPAENAVKVFGDIEDEVLEWMGDVNYTTEVLYMPLHYAVLTKDLFVMPAFSKLFPLLDHEEAKALERFQERSSPDTQKSSPSALSFEELPINLQVTVSQWTSALHLMFQSLKVKEDIFTIGSFSKILGTHLEAFPPAKQRRKTVNERVSLILIDRTLDLAGPALSIEFESVLDKILNILPEFSPRSNDVRIDMAPMFGLSSELTEQDIFPGGCLAPSVPELKMNPSLDDFIKKDEGDLINDLQNELTKISEKSANKEDPILAFLEELIGKEDLIAEHLDLIELSRALVTTNANVRQQTFKQLKDVALKFLKSKKREMKGYLIHVTKMIRSRKERGLMLEDILQLVTFLYAILPPGEDFYPEDEDRLQSALSEAIVKDSDKLGPILKELSNDSSIDELLAFQIVKTMFEKLKSLRVARKGLNHYQSLLSDSKAYSPFMSQLFQDVFADDRRDVPDLEHRTGGLGGLLKSGIGFLGVSVNKMHPRENPNLWVFVIGGVTASEVKAIHSIVRQKSQCELLIGSTRLLSARHSLHSLFNINPFMQ